LKKGPFNVFVIKSNDRVSSVKKLVGQFDIKPFNGKTVAIKANYNSADPFPASTHIDTLSTIASILKENDSKVILAERSGMGVTSDVLKKMGVNALAKKQGFDILILDALKSFEWIKEKREGHHWRRGFLLAKIFKDSDAIVQTCCFKTHRFGGHFTLSLKNSVGMVAKYDPDDGYNYMGELHASSHQRQMIAEINASYKPEFAIMDCMQGFSKGGPHTGTLIEPGLMMASSDRIALDAAAVALLRIYGTTTEVSTGSIFKQDQIARAIELGLGASGFEDIDIVPLNDEASDICKKIVYELKK
jgi:uncharacterized protein (DUF362 family)